MNKKYLVIGSHVTYESDRDRHWISAQRLCDLYKVNRDECILINEEDYPRRKEVLRLYENRSLIPLLPQYRGLRYNTYLDECIKALSWKQPFASLMLEGKIETRTWPTHYRGLVLICASKKSYKDLSVANICGPEQYARIRLLEATKDKKFVRNEGQAIALGMLVNCRPMKKEDEDACFVQYQKGLYCHVYSDIRAIEPLDYKGSMKWGKVTKEMINKIKFI